MKKRLDLNNEQGFSIVEMMVTIVVMTVITGSVVALMKSSMQITTANYEMTDAQENLRIAQEYITRDLMNAGDGLKSISTIRVPSGFVTSYLTRNPIIDADMPNGIINIGILTSDNNVPAGTVVKGAVPTTTVRALTDRQTILQLDPDPTFPAIALPITPSKSINSAGTVVTFPSGTNMAMFTIGEIYYFSSSLGGTFGTVTGKNAGSRQLTFGVDTADVHGLNVTTNNTIKAISSSGAKPTSMQRMLIIHYYVNAAGFLMRRVFGVKGTAFRDSIVAEHVLSVQFNYSLETTDAAGNIVQPTQALANKAQRLGVRQVESTVTVETPHLLHNNARSALSSTNGTSVRNMQFRQATQPTP